jgi:hypothetical protein
MAKKDLSRHLGGLAIRIRKIQNVEAGGFEVRIITHDSKSVKWIYMFPLDREKVLTAVLTQIGNSNGYPYSRRRPGNP